MSNNGLAQVDGTSALQRSWDLIGEALAPLNEATQRILREVRLRETDTLFITLDNSGRRFHARIACVIDCDKCDGRGVIDKICHACSEERAALKRGLLPFTEHAHVCAGDGAFFSTCDRCDGVREIESSYPGPSAGAFQFFQRIPERFSQDGRDNQWATHWLLAATDFTALVLWHSWPKDQMIFRADLRSREESDAKDLLNYLVRQFLLQSRRAAMVHAFKETRIVPHIDGWLSHPDFQLSDYQRAAVAFVFNYQSAGGGALFMDKGTGKTATAVQISCLLGAMSRRNEGRMVRALVLCPPQVRYNWQLELERFATVPGKVTVIRDHAVGRVKQLTHAITSEDDCDFSLVIIGYDTLPNGGTIDAVEKVPWDVIFCDESHKFKSNRTERWAAVRRLRERSKLRVPMTGTPIGNTLNDVWTQLEFINEGASGFSTFDSFRRFYGVWRGEQGHRGVEKLIGVRNVALLQERFARMCFILTKEEAGLNLPEKIYEVLEVEMSRGQAIVYSDILEKLRVELVDALTGEVSEVIAQHILTKLLRLAQVTSGHLTWPAVIDPDTLLELRPKRTEQLCWPNPKVRLIVDDICDEDADPLCKSVVWCSFVEDIRAVSRGLTERGVEHVVYYGAVSAADREIAQRRFNSDPSCRVMVCNPATAGEGLNLVGYDWWEQQPKHDTYAGSCYFFSCNWSFLERSQAEDRQHRRGTRRQLRVVDVVVPETIDEEIRARVMLKREISALALDVREILRRVFK